MVARIRAFLNEAFTLLLLYLFWSDFLLSLRLRALSSGGSVSSPPASPAMPKYKLAEYRYGREEMLALYVKDNKVGKCLKTILGWVGLFLSLGDI